MFVCARTAAMSAPRLFPSVPALKYGDVFLTV